MNEAQRWELGQFIRVARERKGINQATLGGYVGWSRASISLLETGQTRHPRVGTLSGIAAALDIPPAVIFQMVGVNVEDSVPAQLHWLTTQLDDEHLELLVELGHGLLRVQHRQQLAALP